MSRLQNADESVWQNKKNMGKMQSGSVYSIGVRRGTGPARYICIHEGPPTKTLRLPQHAHLNRHPRPKCTPDDMLAAATHLAQAV